MCVFESIQCCCELVVFHNYPDSMKQGVSAKCVLVVPGNIKHIVTPRFSIKQTVSTMSLSTIIYTVGRKITRHFYFYDNFGKCGLISIIRSLLDS